MSTEAVLAFDVETQLLASEVEKLYDLKGSVWEHPEVFGFAVGVAIEAETDTVHVYKKGRAKTMIEHLEDADATVGYNTAAFDLGVLSAYGDVSAIRRRHVDINALVMRALDDLPVDHRGMGRIRQGGLDGLARANGIEGKTGQATDVPALLRQGRVREVLDYCEADTRIVAALYRLAVERGTLFVDGYLKKGSERIELGRLEVRVATGMTSP